VLFHNFREFCKCNSFVATVDGKSEDGDDEMSNDDDE
jgi:hypothetical protein